MLQTGKSIRFTALVLLIAQLSTSGFTQGPPKKYEKDNRVKPGIYIPELYGDSLGKYRHDDSGKYRHVDVPYTGGYGDRGPQYKQNKDKQGPSGTGGSIGKDGSTGSGGSTGPSGSIGPTGPPDQPVKLGPKDRLRFMVDFNYNNNGWQIVQFDWLRGDEVGKFKPKYTYVNERKLWESNDPGFINKVGTGYYYGPEGKDNEFETTTINDGLYRDTTTDTIHLDAEYESNTFNYTFLDEQKPASDAETRAAINDVLEYLKTYVIPNLS